MDGWTEWTDRTRRMIQRLYTLPSFLPWERERERERSSRPSLAPRNAAAGNQEVRKTADAFATTSTADFHYNTCCTTLLYTTLHTYSYTWGVVLHTCTTRSLSLWVCLCLGSEDVAGPSPGGCGGGARENRTERRTKVTQSVYRVWVSELLSAVESGGEDPRIDIDRQWPVNRTISINPSLSKDLR